MSFLQRNWNLGNFLVVAGCVGLGVTLWVPYGTAKRVARVEDAALRMGRKLLQTARDGMPLNFADPANAAGLLAQVGDERLRSVAAPDGAAAIGPGFYFQSKHYCFSLVASPDDWPLPPVEDERPTAVELYAWPRSFLGPGRTSFFLPTDDTAAYTRNLQARYAGFDVVPVAGGGRPVGAPAAEQSWYRGRDDGRWIALPASAGKPQQPGAK